MVMAGDDRVQVKACRKADRIDLVKRLLARGLSSQAVLQACIAHPVFDYLDDHINHDFAARQEGPSGKDLKTNVLSSFGMKKWRYVCANCLSPVYPAVIGCKPLETKCRVCSSDLRQSNTMVQCERRGLTTKVIMQDISDVRVEVRREQLEENTEIMDARLRLLEVFRSSMERKEFGIAVRAQRELSRMLGLRRRMSEESIGGDLGERLAAQLAEMTTLTRVMGGVGDIETR